MARLGGLLSKQGHFLLENDRYALLYIAVLVLIPFAAWLSATIVALITLRKGWVDGFRAALVGFTTLLFLSTLSMSLLAAVVTAFIAFIPCFLTAVVLRATASWQTAAIFLVLQILVGILLIHWLAPDLITNQYQYIEKLVKELQQSTADSSLTNLLDKDKGFNPVVIANYMLGVQALSVAILALIPLILARSIQSELFYPDGFRQEMVAFRAHALGVVLLLFALIGAYQHNPLAISCLPVLVAYYVWAGISLSLYALAKDKGISWLLLLIVPLILLPLVALPVYVMFGALDSLFNFRLRLSQKPGE